VPLRHALESLFDFGKVFSMVFHLDHQIALARLRRTEGESPHRAP
jgi:hypothetical protein